MVTNARVLSNPKVLIGDGLIEDDTVSFGEGTIMEVHHLLTQHRPEAMR